MTELRGAVVAVAFDNSVRLGAKLLSLHLSDQLQHLIRALHGIVADRLRNGV